MENRQAVQHLRQVDVGRLRLKADPRRRWTSWTPMDRETYFLFLKQVRRRSFCFCSFNFPIDDVFVSVEFYETLVGSTVVR